MSDKRHGNGEDNATGKNTNFTYDKLDDSNKSCAHLRICANP